MRARQLKRISSRKNPRLDWNFNGIADRKFSDWTGVLNSLPVGKFRSSSLDLAVPAACQPQAEFSPKSWALNFDGTFHAVSE